MKKFLLLAMATLLAFPLSAFAASSEEAMMAELQKQIAELSEELEERSDRLDGPERHSALDRINFSGDLRSRVHSVHYDDVTFNPGINVDFTDFFFKAGAWMTDTPPGSGAARAVGRCRRRSPDGRRAPGPPPRPSGDDDQIPACTTPGA